MQHDEVAFVRGLGRWAPRARGGQRERCLRGYLAALDTRVDWFEGADVDALRATAEALLGDQRSQAA